MSTSPPAARRYATLDAWRGFACLLVVISHSTILIAHSAHRTATSVGDWLVHSTAWFVVGVPLFFVISGYCIAATAETARLRGTAVGQYFVRRFRRIYPAYWAAAGVALLLAVVLDRTIAPGLATLAFGPVFALPDPAAFSVSHWLGGLTLTETWRPLVNPSVPGQQLLGPAWTLCYEEQFYAVTGVLLLVAGRWFFAGIAVVTTVVAVGVVFAWGGLPVRGTFLDGRWLMFAAGVGVYWAVTRSGWLPRAALVSFLVVAIGYSLRNPDVLLDPMVSLPLADGKELLPACVFALLLLVAHRWDGRTAESRVGRFFGGVGRYSYSLYLVHYPICLAVSYVAFRAGITGAWPTLLVVVPLCVWLSMRAGEAFYRAVERRFAPTPAAPGAPAPAPVPRPDASPTAQPQAA
jgi:peptidoglycan/LPS O-acetylase OafA/YrhL